jgi:hypothetical protein
LLRFSVRGLIVLVIVAGAALGWIVRQAHIQGDAVAAIIRPNLARFSVGFVP